VGVGDVAFCTEELLDGGWAASFALRFRVGSRSARVASAVWAREVVACVQRYTDRPVVMDR
jgi:hypothetical protein